MSDKTVLSYINDYGRAVSREVHHSLDIREFTQTAVYPWLAMAANPHLTNEEIVHWLEHVATRHPAVRRPDGWVKRRRKMTRLGSKRPARANADGNDGRAFAIMALAAHHRLSARALVEVLGEHGISRGREWVRTWRGASLPS